MKACKWKKSGELAVVVPDQAAGAPRCPTGVAETLRVLRHILMTT